MKDIRKKGFTLIELLVVITIIWILATGWVSVFTKQLQWARDATRIKDIKLLETAVVLYFSDEEMYPDPANFITDTTDYMSKEVKDPKAGKQLCWLSGSPNAHNQACGWVYVRWDDEYWLPDSAFKLGMYFEKETNLKHKAMSSWKDTDGGASESLYELFGGAGAKTITITTTLADFTTITSGWGLNGLTNAHVY